MVQTKFHPYTYHEAFQNTLRRARLFVDRQVQGWAVKSCSISPAPSDLQCAGHQSGFSTSTLDLPSSSTSQFGDDSMNELTLPLDTSLLKQIPGKLQGTDLAPPSYQSLDHCSLELEDLSSSSSFYHTIHHPKRRSALQSQPKPRPMSMPIFFPDALTTPSSTNHEPLDELFSSSAIAKWQHRRSCVIVPREEEGCENLPPYECTVYKKGKVNVKMLTDANGNKVTNRTWRRLHMELWGTVLRIHALSFFRATIGKDPIDIISLAGAEACRAFDYTKKPFVIRLSILSGIELLIQLPDHASMVSWIEQLQSGINISLDLEHRPMPKFITLPPRRGCENGILTRRLLESERRREQRRQTQQEFLA